MLSIRASRSLIFRGISTTSQKQHLVNYPIAEKNPINQFKYIDHPNRNIDYYETWKDCFPLAPRYFLGWGKFFLIFFSFTKICQIFPHLPPSRQRPSPQRAPRKRQRRLVSPLHQRTTQTLPRPLPMRLPQIPHRRQPMDALPNYLGLSNLLGLHDVHVLPKLL